MEPLVQALVMGIVQGLTEFLPISSSGHLILVPYLLGWDEPFITSLAFSVMLHLGTLAALLAYFAGDWARLIAAGLASLRDRSIGDDPSRRLAWILVVATIPAALIGGLLGDTIESVARRPAIVALALVVGGAILWYADRVGRRDREVSSIGWTGAVAVGFAQAVALVPGVSRSGITISAGRLLGLDRERAARLSFLLAAPTIAGAGLLEAYHLVRGEAGVVPDTSVLLAGVVSAAVTGVLAIRLLLEWFRRRGVGVFVAYRIALALLVVVALLKV
jgi:undecaprenyl-diphosphatase